MISYCCYCLQNSSPAFTNFRKWYDSNALKHKVSYLLRHLIGLRSLSAKTLVGLSHTGCQHNYYHTEQFLIIFREIRSCNTGISLEICTYSKVHSSTLQKKFLPNTVSSHHGCLILPQITQTRDSTRFFLFAAQH